MMMAEYLGKPVANLLKVEPFKDWSVERWEDSDSDPPVVGYIFEKCALQLNCDFKTEIVRSIFLEASEHAGFILSDVPFNLNRAQVLNRFGHPSRSGEGFADPILGEFGPWDRFQLSQCTLHIQYEVEPEVIKKITFMRNDVAPS